MKLGNDVFLFYEVAKFILKFASKNYFLVFSFNLILNSHILINFHINYSSYQQSLD